MLIGCDLRLIVTKADHGLSVQAGRIPGVSPSALTRPVAAIGEEPGRSILRHWRLGRLCMNANLAIGLEGRRIFQHLEASPVTLTSPIPLSGTPANAAGRARAASHVRD